MFSDSPQNLDFVSLPSRTLHLDLSTEDSRTLLISFTVIAPELAPVVVRATFAYKGWRVPTAAPNVSSTPSPSQSGFESLEDLELDLTSAFTRSSQYFFGVDEYVQKLAEKATPKVLTSPAPFALEIDEAYNSAHKWTAYFRTAIHVATYSVSGGELFKKFGKQLPNGTLKIEAKLDEQFLLENHPEKSSYTALNQQLEIRKGSY